MHVRATIPSAMPSSCPGLSLRPKTSRCAPAAYRSNTAMGSPSTSMGRTPTPDLSDPDPKAWLMAAVSRAVDACRCWSREGTPRRGAYGARIAVGDDQAWTAQISAPRRRASAAAHRRAAAEFADPLTPTTIRSSVLTTNLHHFDQAAHATIDPALPPSAGGRAVAPDEVSES
jgi:hypothetical protein